MLLEHRSRVINHLSQNVRDLFKEMNASTCSHRLGTRGPAKDVQEKRETLHHMHSSAAKNVVLFGSDTLLGRYEGYCDLTGLLTLQFTLRL